MEPRFASFMAALVCVPAFFYLVYRAIAPYESVMPGRRLGGSMLYPAIAGFILGIVHGTMDLDLLNGGFGALSFLLLYPLIETYVVIVIFNRTFFFKQPATAVYFGLGSGAMAIGLAFVDVYRSLLAPAIPGTEIWILLAMVGLATSYVLFHAAKGLLLGTYYSVGSRRRGVLLCLLYEVPFGALLLTARFGADPAEIVPLLMAYALLFYYFTWNSFFPRRMPEELRRALEKESKRARRVRRAQEGK